MDITPNRHTHNHSNTKIQCFKIKMSGVSLPKQTKQKLFWTFGFFFVQKFRKPRDPAPRRFSPKKFLLKTHLRIACLTPTFLLKISESVKIPGVKSVFAKLVKTNLHLTYWCSNRFSQKHFVFGEDSFGKTILKHFGLVFLSFQLGKTVFLRFNSIFSCELLVVCGSVKCKSDFRRKSFFYRFSIPHAKNSHFDGIL